MQKCIKCEWEFPDNVHICPYCGHPVEPDDQKQKRRFNLRWHQNTLLAGMKRPQSTLGPSQTGYTTPSKKPSQVTIIVITLVVTLVLGTTLAVLVAKNGLVSSAHPTLTVSPSLTQTVLPNQVLAVTPSLLDFGQVAVGSKPVLSVIVKKSSEFPLTWQIVPASVQWLVITLRPKVSQSSNLREDIYDVTANTSKLNMGNYSALLSLSSDRGSTQRVPIKIQVIQPKSPSPAKLSVNPLLLDFGSQTEGKQKTLQRILTMINSGGEELRWTADTGQAFWLMLDQNTGRIAVGATPQSINVKVDTSTLSVGQHTAVINFTSNGGNASANVTVTVVSVVTLKKPIVLSISQKCGLTAGGTSITITGTGFTNASNISFGSTAATSFTVTSDTQITAVSPAGQGTVDVMVTTPGGTSATSPSDQFTYPTLPSVSLISPTSGPNAGGTSITITGSGFICATSVSFATGSTAATSFTVSSDTQITAVSPPAESSANSTVNVTVTTPGGTSATSTVDQFTYLPSPSVSNIDPTNGSTLGGTSVTITGSGFTNASNISFGSTAATSFTVISDTQITAVSPAGQGIVDVTVTTPGGASATSTVDQFTYIPLPVVTSVSPTGGYSSGGDTVTITGTGFIGATNVSFGTIVAPNFTVINDTTITVNSPPDTNPAFGYCSLTPTPNNCISDETLDVMVTTVGGTSASNSFDHFTYYLPPLIK